MSAHWWLSFADAELPPGSKFLGACVVEGDHIAAATKRAWQLGCNPGGEVRGIKIDDYLLPSQEWRNRLLTKSEALALRAIINERARQ